MPRLWIGLVALVATLIPELVLAADRIAEDNLLDSILYTYKQAADRWAAPLANLALDLFYLLALLELTVSAMWKLFENGSISDILLVVVRWILTTGFFLMIINAALGVGPFDPFAEIVIDSFREAGAIAGGGTGGIRPNDIVEAALNLVSRIFNEIEFSGEGVVLALVGVLIAAIFGIIAAMVTVTLIEIYLVVNAGVILLAFAGNSYTREFVMSYLRYLVSAGMKVMFMYLVISIGQSIMDSWVETYQELDMMQTLVLFISSVILMFIVKEIPNLVSGLMSGVGSGGSAQSLGNAAVNTATTAAAVHGPEAAKSMAAHATAGYESTKSAAQIGGAGEQLAGAVRSIASGGGDNLGGAFSQATKAGASIVGNAAKTYSSELAKDLGRQMTGHADTRYGSTGSRMTDSIRANQIISPGDAVKAMSDNKETNGISG